MQKNLLSVYMTIFIVFFFSRILGFFEIHNNYNWICWSFGFPFVEIINQLNILTVYGSTTFLDLEFYNSQAFDVIWYTTSTRFDFFVVITVSLAFIAFLLLQANFLNEFFYPNQALDSEKYSPYECGFAPFKTEWSQFDIKFYLIALLFLIFDVELMFILPYCLSYYYLGLTGYGAFMIFFSILLIGFLMEWAAGILVWKGEHNLSNFEKKIFWLKFPQDTQLGEITPHMYLKNFLDKIDSKRCIRRYWKHSLWYSNKILNRFMYRRPYKTEGYKDPSKLLLH